MRYIALVALFALGCSPPPRWAYRPTPATARADAPKVINGHHAASYNVPGGAIEVTTVGVSEVRPPHEPKKRTAPMVHVHMVVRHGAGDLWVVDPFEQIADIGDLVREAPRFALVDGNDVTPAVLRPGETRTVDLYYLMPEGRLPPNTLPWVTVDWRVRTPAKILARADSGFEPYELPPPKVPPPDPRKMAKALEEKPRDGNRHDGAALPPPTRNDIAGGLGR
jgi:hypothetical protein